MAVSVMVSAHPDAQHSLDFASETDRSRPAEPRAREPSESLPIYREAAALGPSCADATVLTALLH